MSIIFSVKNKKKILGGYANAMVVEEVLRLVPNLEQFSVFEGDEGYDEFIASELGEDIVLAGIYGISGRGFELNYEENSYVVRINTPSSASDWRIVLEFLSALSRKVGSDIQSEDGEIYDTKSILSFEYERDIWAGFEAIKHHFEEESELLTIYGIMRSVDLDKKIIDEILSSDDPLGKFDEFMRENQSLDAYTAKQNLYERDGQIKGVYVLSQNLPTILPFKPNIEWHYMEVLGDRKVDEWVINLVGGDGEDPQEFDILGEIDYDKFVQILPKESYRFVDANNILVSALSFDELKELARLGQE